MKSVIAAYISLALILFSRPCSAQLTPQQQKNLTAFTRLYGYVRYFHPSDEAATLDWDGFAIYGAGKMLEPRNDKELLSALQDLFSPIAPTVLLYADGEKRTFSAGAITPADTAGFKTIVWQHFGVGIADNNLYKSIRINRSVLQKQAAPQGFAPFGQTFSAAMIRGREFRFSGWMKVDSTQGGAGHFWMRVHKKKEMVFFYNMANRPATSNTWKEYTFTGQADKDADTVVLGAFLAGKGALLVDHIRLSVKEGSEWKEISSLENGSFEKNDSGAAIGWHYNHQLAGYRYATEIKDVQDGTHAFSVNSIAVKGEKLTNGPDAQPLFDSYPKPGEYVQQSVITGISCIVPLALYGNESFTFPRADAAALAGLQSSIQAAHPATANGDALAVRLGDVIISWNIFRHFFPYWEDASATPEQILDKALAGAANARNRYDFQKTLESMTAPLNDGHIYIFMQGDTVRQAYAPLVFARAEGQVVIDRVLDSSLALRPGDVIKTINGRSADRYIANLDLTTSGSPQLKVFRDLIDLTVGPRDSTLALNILRPDGTHTVTVKRTLEWQAWHHRQTNHLSGWIKPGVFFIDIERDPMDSINAWMPQLMKARAIICDLRGYPNGNHGLIMHLMDKSEDAKWMFVPQVTRPDFQDVTYKDFGWQLKPDSPRLKGQVFFLTQGSAISYAESYMGYIKDLHLATVVGQPTAGTNGNINPFVLPGGYHVSFSGMLVKDHNGGKHHLKGIVPDVPVERTIKGIREGRDEFLEKAIELAGQKKD